MSNCLQYIAILCKVRFASDYGGIRLFLVETFWDWVEVKWFYEDLSHGNVHPSGIYRLPRGPFDICFFRLEYRYE